ncbi:MAG: hypothetical protein J7M20_01425, partial [Deltaproteobacteria bacterium]|nr:hypothetical protein [Deltaproteobacteria bacterium]
MKKKSVLPSSTKGRLIFYFGTTVTLVVFLIVAVFSRGMYRTLISENDRLIKAHTHLINYFNINDFLSYAIPSGVTTLMTEVESYGFALGAEGVKIFLDQVDPCPIKMFVLVPPMISLSPATKSLMISKEQLAGLFEDPRVIGLGESFWQGAILTRDNRVLDLMAETQRIGKSVQGHAAGAFDRKLAAYVATGVE